MIEDGVVSNSSAETQQPLHPAADTRSPEELALIKRLDELIRRMDTHVEKSGSRSVSHAGPVSQWLKSLDVGPSPNVLADLRSHADRLTVMCEHAEAGEFTEEVERGKRAGMVQTILECLVELTDLETVAQEFKTAAEVMRVIVSVLHRTRYIVANYFTEDERAAVGGGESSPAGRRGES